MTLLKKMEKAARILPKAQSTVADFVAKHSREVVFMGTSKNVKFPLAYHTPPKNQGDFAKKCMNLS